MGPERLFGGGGGVRATPFQKDARDHFLDKALDQQ
jgi:hypothetical protein